MKCPDCQETMTVQIVPVDIFDPSREDGHLQKEVTMYVCPECGYEIETNEERDAEDFVEDEDIYIDEFDMIDNSDDGVDNV